MLYLPKCAKWMVLTKTVFAFITDSICTYNYNHPAGLHNFLSNSERNYSQITLIQDAIEKKMYQNT